MIFLLPMRMILKSLGNMVFGNKTEYKSYVRNFIFGVEDSLVSTVGLLSGIASADASRHTIILTGVVLIFVEAFSMGVGSYLSENSTANYQPKGIHKQTPIFGGVIMLVSYLLAGLVPLLPYVILRGPVAFWWSIVFSLIGLVGLGVLSSKLLKANWLKNSLRMLILGGIAIAIGVIVGNTIKI